MDGTFALEAGGTLGGILVAMELAKYAISKLASRNGKSNGSGIRESVTSLSSDVRATNESVKDLSTEIRSLSGNVDRLVEEQRGNGRDLQKLYRILDRYITAEEARRDALRETGEHRVASPRGV